MMFCHGTILGSVVVYIASIQMSLKLRILLMLKSMHLDLHLEIDNWGISKTKLYDKRDFFTFPIVNVPFMGSNIRAPQAHGVYISQLIRYSRACVQYRAQLLTQNLKYEQHGLHQNQGMNSGTCEWQVVPASLAV
jgi:hypothetical protein